MNGKIDIEKAKALRAKGMTYREIAGRFGVTAEAVRQQLSSMEPANFNAITEKRCIYPGIRLWMNQQHITTRRLTVMMGYALSSGTVSRIARVLSGNTEIKIGDILVLLRLTGMTFEEAFGDGNAT